MEFGFEEGGLVGNSRTVDEEMNWAIISPSLGDGDVYLNAIGQIQGDTDDFYTHQFEICSGLSQSFGVAGDDEQSFDTLFG